MDSLLSLTSSLPTRTLEAGEILMSQGEAGGDLFFLKSGKLTVERDGVTIAELANPGALIGEMSVLLGTKHSATVRASGAASVRVIRDAKSVLEKDPALTFAIARLMAGRLDVTSALLVNMTKEHSGKAERSVLSRIFSALHLQEGDSTYSAISRNDMFAPTDRR